MRRVAAIAIVAYVLLMLIVSAVYTPLSWPAPEPVLRVGPVLPAAEPTLPPATVTLAAPCQCPLHHPAR